MIFDGGEPNPDSVLTKEKSDYVTKPMTEQGLLTLRNGLVKAPGEIAVLCEPINKVAADATAFVHRANTKYVMQHAVGQCGRHQCKHRDDANLVYVDGAVCFEWMLCELL